MTKSIGQILACSPKVLSKVSACPKLDVELLLSAVLGVSREYLHTWPERTLNHQKFVGFEGLLEQRKQGKPMAYILGEKEFWSLKLKVNAATLIPRPETELLVDIILKNFSFMENLSVLDLGTGSGAIALALATEQPTWQITAVDCCPEALAVARVNADNHNITSVEFIHSNWYANVRNRKYNIIVSNPPYIAEGDPALELYVLAYEPKSALIADQAGLGDILDIIHKAQYFLKTNGFILLEHGYQQEKEVKSILRQYAFNNIQCHPDLSGTMRAVSGCL